MTAKPRLIALYSPAPGSGKTTAALVCENEGYKITSFARPLKNMVVAFLMDLGYSKGDATELINDKNYVISEINLRVRDIMQTLGTEWGRNLIHQDVWIKTWESKQKHFPFAVVDDMRFANEYAAVKSKGGIFIKIERQLALNESKETHSSEGALNNFEFDYTIENNFTLEKLESSIISIIKEGN